jgi:hypothetical protein
VKGKSKEQEERKVENEKVEINKAGKTVVENIEKETLKEIDKGRGEERRKMKIAKSNKKRKERD